MRWRIEKVNRDSSWSRRRSRSNSRWTCGYNTKFGQKTKKCIVFYNFSTNSRKWPNRQFSSARHGMHKTWCLLFTDINSKIQNLIDSGCFYFLPLRLINTASCISLYCKTWVVQSFTLIDTNVCQWIEVCSDILHGILSWAP